MDASKRLFDLARDYEILAAWSDERAQEPDHRESAAAFTVVSIVLREIAAAFEEAA